MMTDPIADMLTRIRNAHMAQKRHVEIPFSKLKYGIAQILFTEGYVERVEKKGDVKQILSIDLKYYGKTPAIQVIERESSPGHRTYRKASELPRVLNDYGVAVMSTSKGLMTNKEAAKQGVGGEVLCIVY